MQYPILTYGRPELRQPCRPVQAVDAQARRLIDDMLETMYAANGIGLAATQVGRSEAVCVIDVGGAPRAAEAAGVAMPLVLVNPRLTGSEGTELDQEGCLSFPELYVSVKRAAEIGVTFLDRDGRPCAVRFRGFLARVVQHELDHLNGMLLVDRMTVVQKAAAAGKLKRLKKSVRNEQRGDKQWGQDGH